MEYGGGMIDGRLMSCQFTQEAISRYLDNQLTESERSSVVLHMAACGECATRHERMVELRGNLRSLPIALAPARLATELQVLASRELVRRRRRSSVSALMQSWKDRARLLIDNLMRPLALPFVGGGLTSALFIFGMLMPSLGFLHNAANDTPSGIYTEASVIKVAAFASPGKSSDDTVVEVQIDGQGHMVDYNVLQGQMTGEIGNLLLFSTFTPATMFLQPTAGKVVIRRSQIVVKG
jgi:anti-sigma factor RsiW